MESIKISQNLHVGVELGGTSCKAAIFKKEVTEDAARFVQVGY